MVCTNCSSRLPIPRKHAVLAWPLRGGRLLCTRKQLLLGNGEREGLVRKAPSSRKLRILEGSLLKMPTSSMVPP